MKLLPRHYDSCVMCQPAPGREAVWRSGPEIALRYCESACEPSGANGFIEATTLNYAPQPHLHVTCQTCGYVWLIETSQHSEAT